MTDMTGYDMTCDAFAERLGDYLEGDLSGADHEAMDAHAGGCASCAALRGELLLITRDAAALPVLQPSRDLWSGIADRLDASVLPMEAARQARTALPARRGWVRPAIAAAALVIVTAGVSHVLTRISMAPTSAPTSSVAMAPSVSPAPASHSDAAMDSLPVATRQVASVRSNDVGTEEGAPQGAGRSAGRSPATDRSTRAGSRLASVAAPRAAAGGGTVRLARSEPLLHEVEPVYDREIAKLRGIVRERRAQLDPRTIAVLEQSVAVIDSAIAQSRAALARDPASGFLATQLNHSLEKKVELLRTAALLPARS
jgi:hypothetical protein